MYLFEIVWIWGVLSRTRREGQAKSYDLVVRPPASTGKDQCVPNCRAPEMSWCSCRKATCRVGMCMMLADQAKAPGRTSSHSSSAGSPPGRPGTQWCVDSSYVQPGAPSALKMSWKCSSSPSTHCFISSVGFYCCHLVLRKLSNMRTERYLKPTRLMCK